MTMTLLEIAKEIKYGFILKGKVIKKVYTNVPKNGGDDWKMLTFTLDAGSDGHEKLYNCIGWSNKKNGTTFADDHADLGPGEEVVVTGKECKNNEYTRQGLKVEEPQHTVTEMVRLGIPAVEDQQPGTSDSVDTDDDTGDTFL